MSLIKKRVLTGEVRHRRLRSLLYEMGIGTKKNGRLHVGIDLADLSKLWDYRDRARAWFVEQMKLAHPDRPGGNLARAQYVNAVRERVSELFVRIGIDPI